MDTNFALNGDLDGHGGNNHGDTLLPWDVNGVCSDWMIFNETIADYDVSEVLRAGKSQRAARNALDQLRGDIEGRTEALAIKVPAAYILQLAEHVHKNWGGYFCEASLDHLLFKAPQSPQRGAIAFELGIQFRTWGGPAAYTTFDPIMKMTGGDSQRAPDVAFYSIPPTLQQKMHPLRNNLEPPNCWVEIFYNQKKDRNAALEKIRDDVIATCGATCAVLAIGLPSADTTDSMRARVGFETPAIFAGAGTTAAPIVAGGRPASAPYIGYWPPGTAFVDGQWFRVYRNTHLEVAVHGRVDPFMLDLNFIVDNICG